jgi:S-DNA-T family DNA segregation ATPase FtsK/SpoIIIE
VHTVLTVVTSTQVRVRLSANFGGRIELRLSDPFDSAIDRHLAAELPGDTPGRALLSNKRYLQVALPRIDGGTGLDDLSDGVAAMVRAVSDRWPATRVPVVQVLPERVSLDTVGPSNGRTLPIGLSERDLGPVEVDLFGGDPHLLVYGDPQTGKSTLLRAVLHQLVGQSDPDRLGIVLVDYRRSHLGVVPDKFLLAYCTSAEHTEQVAAGLAADLRARMPGPGVTAQQLRDRSWWQGVEVVVVVDDYDLVATAAGGSALAALAGLLTQGRDLGVHLVLARRTGGAARFQYEPVLQALNDMSSPGLLFSGDRMEGRLVAGIASQRLPVGRAVYARRGRPPEQVQIGWTAPPD